MMNRTLILSALVLLTLPRCTPKVDLVQNGLLCVTLDAPDDLPLRSLSVTQDGPDLVVRGSMDYLRPPREAVVELFSSDGTRLAHTTVKAVRPGHRGSRRRFEARLPAVAEKGSRVRIAYGI